MQNETYFSTDPGNLVRTADNGGRRVIVVDSGTDYIDRIMRSCPDRALFVTDPEIRGKGTEPVLMERPACWVEKWSSTVTCRS
jgi:hypothetical protein